MDQHGKNGHVYQSIRVRLRFHQSLFYHARNGWLREYYKKSVILSVRLSVYHAQSLGAVVDTLVRTKFLQLYSGQGTIHAYRAYKNRPNPKLTWLPFLVS